MTISSSFVMLQTLYDVNVIRAKINFLYVCDTYLDEVE